MAAYQNIFTQVQLRSKPEFGAPLPAGNDPRVGTGQYHYWLGKLGAAQIGPELRRQTTAQDRNRALAGRDGAQQRNHLAIAKDRRDDGKGRLSRCLADEQVRDGGAPGLHDLPVDVEGVAGQGNAEGHLGVDEELSAGVAQHEGGRKATKRRVV